MKWILTAIFSLSAVAFGAWQLNGDPPDPSESDQIRLFMQRKLDHSKSILEGLVLEDHDKIAKHAQALSLLSLESSWNVLTTQEYLQQSSNFRRSIRTITEGARKQNIDRATLGYVDLTVRCVECHTYMRRRIAGELPDSAQ